MTGKPAAGVQRLENSPGHRSTRTYGGNTMSSTRRRTLPALIVLSLAVTMTACSGDDDAGVIDSSAPTNSTDSTEPVIDEPEESPYMPEPLGFNGVPEAILEGPITGGLGVPVAGTGNFDGTAFGYSESEYFISGTANSYTSAEPLSDDGQWNVEVNDTADYRTRIVVRQPTDPSSFNGTVMVEWMNVTAGLDVPPVWSYSKVELMRSGTIWVGVSAQRVGIEGGGNPLGAIRVLKNADPERYGSLVHPGDNYSYDLFSQVGATIWRNASVLFAGGEPERMIAAGESQSAFRLTTYLNALAPTHDVFHGYLVHSRGSRSAQLSSDPGPDVPGSQAARIRTDLTRPVLTLSAETDVVGQALGYRRAAQPDTDVFRSWEIAGTAHADVYSLGIGDTDDGSGRAGAELFEAMLNPPSSVYFGLINCDLPINAGPHTYVVRSAISALDQWIRSGVAPQSMEPLEATEDLEGFVLDERGLALGGIRTPHVDVPVAVLSGLGQAGGSFCGLFGTTTPFTADQRTGLYADKAEFQRLWAEATERAVARGAILEADVAEVLAAAERYPG